MRQEHVHAEVRDMLSICVTFEAVTFEYLTTFQVDTVGSCISVTYWLVTMMRYFVPLQPCISKPFASVPPPRVSGRPIPNSIKTRQGGRLDWGRRGPFR